MFIKIRRKFMYNVSVSGAFHGQAHYIIKWHFQHFSTGRTYQTYDLFKDLSLNIKTSMTKVLSFVLIPSIVALELCMSQGQWNYIFVLENHNSVLGSRMF